eukprot:scaffold407351_cov16-Prasinocladus_malaysianus.AAC.1
MFQDWVPRATYRNARQLRDSLMKASTHCRQPKLFVHCGGAVGAITSKFRDERLFYETRDLPEEPRKAGARQCMNNQMHNTLGMVWRWVWDYEPGPGRDAHAYRKPTVTRTGRQTDRWIFIR